MDTAPMTTEIAGRHVDRRADRRADRQAADPVARHVGRHAAVADANGEPTDAWATAYTDGADRAGKARSRLHPESRVERRGRRRRRDRA